MICRYPTPADALPRISCIAVLCLLLFIALLPGAVQAAQSDDGIDVAINVDGDEVQIDISALIEARPREVWAVFTDFDRMADFVSNLNSSQVIARSNVNNLTVEQHGRAGIGPVSFTLDSVREIQMKPFESIRSRLLSGGMKRFDGMTRLSEESGKTRVTYHSDAIWVTWIPPVIGRRVIEEQAREQFAQMLQEVLRRKQATAANSR